MEHKTEIYEMGRGEGKTYKMLKMSEELGIPIVCKDKWSINMYKRKAENLKIKIVEPIHFINLIKNKERKKVLIDEIRLIVKSVLEFNNQSIPIFQCIDDLIYFIEKEMKCEVYACTYTPIRLEMKFIEDFENQNKLIYLEREAKKLDYKIIKEEE